MSKKLIRTMLCSLLAVIMLFVTACGNSNVKETGTAVNQDSGSNEAVSETEAVEEVVDVEALFANDITISCLSGGPSGSAISNYSENEYFINLAEKTGVTIEFTHPASWDSSEFDLMLSGGDYYDLIWSIGRAGGGELYIGGDDAAVDDGVFLDLTPYVEKYMPNYWNLIQTNEYVKKLAYTDSGRIVCIVNAQYSLVDDAYIAQPAFAGITIRKDWLDELGLEVPETYDEWTIVLRAIKEKYGCSEPLVMANAGHWAGINFSAGFGALETMQLNGNTVEYGPMTDGWKQYVTLMNQWYEEGLIGAEYITNGPVGLENATMISGDAGAMFMVFKMKDAIEASIEGAEIVACPFPTVNKGDVAQGGTIKEQVASKKVYVTTALDEEKIPQVLAMLDSMYTDEGIVAAAYGVEGDTYTIDENGNYVFTEKMTSMDLATAMDIYLCPGNYQLVKEWNRELFTLPESMVKMCDVWDNRGYETTLPALTLTPDENTKYSTIMTDVQTYMVEMTNNFIMGNVSIEEEWDAYIEGLKGMKIDEAIAINQAAYERYLAK